MAVVNQVKCDSSMSAHSADDLLVSGGTLYYGVNVLPGNSGSETDSPLVFTDKSDALNTARKYKGARFKAFSNHDEAVSFSVQKCSTPKGQCSQASESSSPGSVSNLTVTEELNNIEKSSPYKAPRSQEMVKLRKAIEIGDVEYFISTVWSNPRYLISSGDTPTIMQDGFRYNGLHVAARSNQPKMCQSILSTVEDEKFMKLLYCDDSPEVVQQRKRFIIDLYLNMPDKGMCETPLHFASKFGCLKAVEILLNHYACDRTRLNKYEKTAKEVICERNGSDELKNKIEQLYEARYFVPVLRSEGNTIQPIVGRPFSFEENVLNFTKQPTTPKNPLLKVKAKAGPMSFNQACLFYKMWKAPTTPLNRIAQEVRFSDSDKGLERIGRNVAELLNVPWTEHWSFMSSWCNLSSCEGLTQLEKHLKQIYSNVINEIKALDESDFLQQSYSSSVLDDSLTSPITQLCRQLEAIHLNSTPTEANGTLPLFGINCISTPQAPFSSEALRDSNIYDVVKTLKFDTPSPNKESQVTRRSSLDTSIKMNEETPRGMNFHITEISEGLSFKLIDIISARQNTNDCTDLLQSILPVYDKFVKCTHQQTSWNLYKDVAVQTAQKLSEDLCTDDIRKVSELCDVLTEEEEDMDQSFSDPEELYFQTRGYSERSAVIPKSCKSNHLKYILKQVKQQLTSTNESPSNCFDNSSFTRLPKSVSFFKKTSGSNKMALETNHEDNNNTLDDETSDEEFVTPPSSKGGSRSNSPAEMHTPDEGIEVFVEGLKPTKSDLDVLNALQGVMIDPTLYPHVRLWKHLIDSFPKEVTKSWITPVAVLRTRSAPSRIMKKDHFLHFSSGKQKTSSVFSNRTIARLSKKSPTEIKNLYDSFTT